MLRERLISASVLVAICALCLYIDYRAPLAGVPGLMLLPLLGMFAGGTAWEMAKLLAHGGRLVRPHIALAGTMMITGGAALPMLWLLGGEPYPVDCPVGRMGWIVVGTVGAVAIAIAAEMAAYGRGPKGGTERAACATLVAVYVGVPLGIMISIRNLGTDANWGLAAVVSMIVVTKASDTGAYFTGRMLGRHKMIPLLSPGKTWEGAAGGIGLSVGAAYACFYWLFPALCPSSGLVPVWGAPLFGVSCAFAGMVGDLAESFFKRDCGAKDSGGLLPGMGGVWDVTDSLIGASLPAFLCFAAGAAGP